MKLPSIIVLLVSFTACQDGWDPNGIKQQIRLESEARERPCADQSTLLATTAGSPSFFQCPNKDHRMRVQVASAPSNEEGIALVFCECVRPMENSSINDSGTK